MLLLMRGGFDSILTTCAKTTTDVDENVDVPYTSDQAFLTNGKMYGPNLKGLEQHLGDAAILNGVWGGSVQHDYGIAQIIRLQNRTKYSVPSIGEVVGGHLRLHPLPAIAFGTHPLVPGIHPPGLLSCTRITPSDRTPCDDILDRSHDQLLLAAEGFDQLAHASNVGDEITRSAQGVAAFMRRVADVPKPHDEHWLAEIPPEQRNAQGAPMLDPTQQDLQRTLWILENELATSVTIQPLGLEWDTHTTNLTNQTKNNNAFFPLLARFLDELKVRKNSHGTLASQTLVVAMSELGRSPRLNSQDGKDHFPEMPVIMFGPRVKAHDENGPGAIYGDIGRRMEAQPISMKTGRASATGFKPTLTDVGATVLAAFGIAPQQYAYLGNPLQFLVEV